MLRHLRIQNFKAWKDTGNIELAPITVFLGTNSSGKSSIAQFLMMLKQTVEHNEPNEVLFTGDQNSIVDVGTPPQMLYGHDTDQPLHFSYDWNLDMPYWLGVKIPFDDSPGNVPYFEVTRISMNNVIKIWPYYMTGSMDIWEICYNAFQREKQVFSLGMEKDTGRETYHMLFKTPDETAVDQMGDQADFPASPFKFYGFSDSPRYENTEYDTFTIVFLYVLFGAFARSYRQALYLARE